MRYVTAHAHQIARAQHGASEVNITKRHVHSPLSLSGTSIAPTEGEGASKEWCHHTWLGAQCPQAQGASK
eukprot:9880573-Alexandrium_andersonii.AAC.1